MIVVNLFAGPGSGKSTTCAGVFSKLKLAGVNCEMALEYAKDKVWEESIKTLDNQIYVFGKQLHRMWRLKDKVDVIITDSPLPLSIYYDKSDSAHFKNLVMEQFNSFDNYNFFIVRDSSYNPKGRLQTREEACKIDYQLHSLLQDNDIPYDVVSKEGAIEHITHIILQLLEENK